MQITVYSQPGCQPCLAVARKLDQLGATYSKVDVTEDEAAAERLRLLGYHGTPVTLAGEHHWQGYVPDRLIWAAQQQGDGA